MDSFTYITSNPSTVETQPPAPITRSIDTIFTRQNASDVTRYCPVLSSGATSDQKIEYHFFQPRIVQTVLLIGRNSDISIAIIQVGDGASTWTTCTQAMQSSIYRVFNCPNTVGAVLKIQSPNTAQLGLCQVRAYSWAYEATWNIEFSGISGGSCQGQGLSTQSFFLQTCNIVGEKRSDYKVYVRIDIRSTKYIWAVTLIGPDSSMEKAKNWKLSVGNKQLNYYLNQEVGRYQVVDDEYGKEIIVGMKGQYITAFRTDALPLSLRWVGIFTTTDGCDPQPTFLWNYTSQANPVILQVQNTASTTVINVNPTMGTCLVAKVATHKNQSPLSNSFAYNSSTGNLTITVNSSSQLGVFELWVTAYVGDGITPNQSEAKLIQTYNICCNATTDASCGTALKVISQNPTTTITSPTEKIGVMLNLCTVSNGFTYKIVYTTGDPNQSTVSGDYLIVGPTLSTTKSVYWTVITFQVKQGSNITTAILDLVITDCKPHVSLQRADGLSLTMSGSVYTAAVTQNSDLDLIWSTSPAVHEKCGKYYIKYTNPVNVKVYTYGDRIRLTPQTAGMHQFDFQLVRSDAETDFESLSLQLTVSQCSPSSLNFNASTTTNKTNLITVMIYNTAKDVEMFFYLSATYGLDCFAPIEYSIVTQLPFVSIVTIGTDKRLRVSTTDTSLNGLYIVSLKAQTGSVIASTTVTINFVTECFVTSIVPPTGTNIQVGQQSQNFEFTVSKTSICDQSSQVVVNYTVQGGTLPSWFSKDQSNQQQVIIDSLQLSAMGTYVITAEAYISTQTVAHVTCTWTITVVSATPNQNCGINILVCPTEIQIVKYGIQDVWLCNVNNSAPSSSFYTYQLTITKPWITFTGTTITIAQSGLQPIDIGTYRIDVMRNLAGTSVMCEQCSFLLQVISACSTAILTVPESLTMNLTFPALKDQTLDFQVTNNLVTNCAAVFEIVPLVDYLTISGGGTNFVITASMDDLNRKGTSAIGTQQIEVKFTLLYGPTSYIPLSVTVTGDCTAVALYSPSDPTMNLSVPAIADQTKTFQVANQIGLECSPSFNFFGSTPSFLTIKGIGSNFVITASMGNLNSLGTSAIKTYTTQVQFMLPNGPTSYIPLSVTVTGDCTAVAFQPPSDLKMNLSVPAIADQTQTFQVTNQFGLQCSPSFDLVASTPSFLTIKGIGSNFEITASKDGLNAAMPSVVDQSYNLVVKYSVVGGPLNNVTLTIKVSLAALTWTKSSNLRPLEEMELNLNEPIPKLLDLPTYSTYPPLPAQMAISKQLVWLDSTIGFTQSLPSVITYDQEKISVRINDLTSKGSYTLQVIATVNYFPTVQNQDIQFTLKLSCTIKRLFLVESKVTDKVYIITPDSPALIETMQIPTYATDPQFCLYAPGYTVTIEPNDKRFISLVDGSIKIETADLAFIGTYQFTLTATEPVSKKADNSVSFKVQIMKCYITKLSPVITAETRVDFTYQLRSARESFVMPSYSWEPCNCNKPLTYQLQNATPGSEATKFPTFLAYDDKTRQVTLNGDATNFQDSGKKFTFKLVVTESESKLVDSSYQFKITTTFKNTAPQFKAALSSQTLKIGQSLTWSLPEATDPDGDPVTKTLVKLGSNTWLSYSESAKSFTAETKSLKEDAAGTYQVEILISDQFNAESKYTQVVVLQKPDLLTNSTATDSQSAAQNTTQSTQPDNRATLNETSTETKSAQSTFVVPAFNPTTWTPPKQQAKKELFLPPLRLMIMQTNDDGTIKLSFNRPVEINPLLLQQIAMAGEENGRRLAQSQKELDQLKLLLKDAFQVKYTPMSETQQAVLIDYTVVEFKDLQDIIIQLNFDQPLLVSADATNDNSMDRVVVSFNNNNIFLDPTTMVALPKDIFNKEVIAIPRQQASSVQANTIKQLLAQSQNVVMAVVPGNLVVSIILGISLKKVWSAINALQFLIYFKLWQVSIPANTEKFVNYVQFIARGEFIPKDKIMNKLMALFHISKSQDKATNFTRFLIVILVGLVVVATLVTLLVCLCRNKESRLAKALIGIKDQIFWNIILRTAIQMYLDLCISAMLVIAAGFNQPFQTVAINIAIIAVLTSIPFVFLAIILQNFNRLSSPQAVKKFGTLYQGVDTSNAGKVMYTFVFLVRRFLFAVYTAFVAKWCNSIAMILVSYLNIAIQFYTVHAFPLETKSANFIEIASEVLLHYTFLSFVFIQLQFTPISEYNAGWITVSTVLLLVLINLTNMLYDVVVKLIVKLRLKYQAYKRKGQQKQLQEEEAACKEHLEMLERFDSDIERITKARASKMSSLDRSVNQSQVRLYSFEKGTDEDIRDELPKAGHIFIKDNNVQTIQSDKHQKEEYAGEEPVFVDTWDDDSPVVLRDYKAIHHERNQSNDLLLQPSFDVKNVFNFDVFDQPPEQRTEFEAPPIIPTDQDIEINWRNSEEESKELPSEDESNPQDFDSYITRMQMITADSPTPAFQETPRLGSGLDRIEQRPNQRKQMPKTDSNWGLQTLAAINFSRSKKR